MDPRDLSEQVALTPPSEAWLKKSDDGFEVGASTSALATLLVVPFMTAWSYYTLSEIYGEQLTRGSFNLVESLFGLIFVGGGAFMWANIVMGIAGKCTLTVHGDQAELFTGVGRLGHRRRFRWSNIRSVTEKTTHLPFSRGSRHREELCLQGSQRYLFGRRLSPERRYFVMHALRTQLYQSPSLPYR